MFDQTRIQKVLSKAGKRSKPSRVRKRQRHHPIPFGETEINDTFLSILSIEKQEEVLSLDTIGHDVSENSLHSIYRAR